MVERLNDPHGHVIDADHECRLPAPHGSHQGQMRHEPVEREGPVGSLHPSHHVKSRTDSGHRKTGPAELRAYAGTELPFLDRQHHNPMVLHDGTGLTQVVNGTVSYSFRKRYSIFHVMI